MKIGFVDSGAGGLLFAIDMISCAQKNGNIDADFFHIGDKENVPYGLKSPEKLKEITQNLIQEAINYGAQKIIVACNTACTVLDADMMGYFVKQNVEILGIKNTTSNFVFQNIEQEDATLLILATKRTVQSKMYKNSIEDLFAQHNRKINIIQHYPIEWEGAVENNFQDTNLKILVKSELEHIKDLMGDEKFSKITHVGLFCTHYPIFKKDIFEFMTKHSQLSSVNNIFSQGEAMSDLLKSETSSEVEIKSFDKSRQSTPLPDCIYSYSKKNNIKINRI